MDQRQGTLRDRKRRAVQDEVAGIAVDLFVANGYEAMTVDQIASAAGLSSRSFFRYFASKEAVVTHLFDTTGADIADALAARPADEGPWVALRRAFDGLIEQLTENPQSLALIRMIHETPVLYASHLHKQTRWNEVVAATIAPRLPESLRPDERRLQAGALASAGVACLEYARQEWVARDGEHPMADLVDVAMRAVAPLAGP
ncbi:TetR/AcrR family transcriptional regulator [Streptomyces fuscichromogenes]|uniref:TetR/AcrR family transcriptional regulator n=1 Tax=Streptomyces fuscichromogenes TaxID=1324013 RepID=UPI00382A8419